MKQIFFIILFSIVSCSSDDSNETSVDSDCTIPNSLSIENVGKYFVELNFNSNQAISFIIEYGETGFLLGSGNTLEFNDYSVEINDLTVSTVYDVYIKSICENGIETEFSNPLTFSTLDCTIPIISTPINITTNSAQISWSDNGESNFEIEYGIEGFEIGSGTNIQVSNNFHEIENLEYSTTYDVYIRTICNNQNYGDFSVRKQFTTLPICNKPENLHWTSIGSSDISFSWSTNGETNWQVEYGLVGFQLGTGTIFNTSVRPTSISGLQNNTTYEIYLRANCGADDYSEYADSLIVTTL